MVSECGLSYMRSYQGVIMLISRLKDMFPWKPVCEASKSVGGWSVDFGLFKRLHFEAHLFLPPMFSKELEMYLRIGPFIFGVNVVAWGLASVWWELDAMVGKDSPWRRYPLYMVGEY